MYEKVTQILKEILKPDDGLVVGVSGGPDSTALLDVFARFSENFPLKLFVAHVNHGLRGKAADEDEKFVGNLAKKFHLPFFSKRVKLSKKSHIEEKGREARRFFFLELKAKLGVKYVVTAHTEDDQLETIVFNFLRGAGPKGLAGMEMIESGFLKPFLTTSKEEILSYLKQRKLKFRKDATNNDTNFRRNFLRKKVLPLFEKVNPLFRGTLIRNRKIFSDIDHWLSQSAEKFLKERAHRTSQSIQFSLKDFEHLAEAEKSSVIQKIYQLGTGNHYRLPFIRVQEVLRMLSRRIGKKRILLGKNAGFSLDKNIVTFNV